MSTPASRSPAAQYAVAIRDEARKAYAAGEIGWVHAGLHEAVADFCEQHNCYATNSARDWFGFGTVTALFHSFDGGFWMSLFDLAEVTGLDYAALLRMYDEDFTEYEGADADLLLWIVTEDGEATSELKLVSHSFAMRAMLAGPWAKEFMDNTMSLFRHAMQRSGLADKIAPVVVVKDGQATTTDMSFGDFLAQGERLPSEEEARAQAMRGPAGAL